MPSEEDLLAAYLQLRRKRVKRSEAFRIKSRKTRHENLVKCMKLLAELQENKGQKRSCWVKPYLLLHDSIGAWAKNIPVMREHDPDQFYRMFRMTPASFDKLLKLVEEHLLKKSWRKSICPGERLAITLRFLTSGDSFRSLEGYFCVAEETISNIVFETCTVLWSVLKPIVFEPLSEDLWLRVSSEFESMWNMPHCCGAIDGKHVQLHAPACTGARFRNYKGFFSTILLAVCDAKQKFLYVDVGSSGRRGDGNVFHSSKFGEMLRENKLHLPPPCSVAGISDKLPFFFVGDAAFPRGTSMITPFKGKVLPPEKKVFNYRVSRARRNIENAFAMLYKRYELFQRPTQCSVVMHKIVILACCALHNYHLLDAGSVRPRRKNQERSRRFRAEDPVKERKTLETLHYQVAKAKSTKGDLMGLQGEEVTEELIDYFIDYDLPWQWKSAGVI